MKKILCFLLLIIILMCESVFADMAPPKLSETTVNISDLTVISENEFTIIKKDGIEIHEGLSEDSKVLGSIPYNTVVKVKSIEEDGFWMYVTYEGISGWIEVDSYALGTKEHFLYEKIMSNWKGFSIYELSGDGTYTTDWIEIAKFPANTMIDEYYRVEGNKETGGGMSYLNYNGISGYFGFDWEFGAENIAESISDTLEQYTVNYEGAILIGLDNEIISVPEGTTLEYTISNNYPMHTSYILTNYNGKDGWVYTIPDYIYDDYITGNDEYEQYRIYCETLQNDIQDTIEYINVKKMNSNENSDNVNIELPINNKYDDLNDENIIYNNTSKVSNQQIIIICILGAIAVATIVTFIIIRINKNK